MRRLVILRPEPGASATAAAARDVGLDPVVLPLFAVEPVEWSPPDPAQYDSLLLTSANSVRHGGAGLAALRSLPAHCVGEATAAAALEAGFTVATVGNGGVDALLEGLPTGLRLLHLCGRERRAPSGGQLSIDALAVYRAAELAPPQQLRSAQESVVAVHSPRSAERLSQLADELGLRRDTISIAAISTEAAAAAGSGWRSVDIASEPSDAALLALAVRLCNKPG